MEEKDYKAYMQIVAKMLKLKKKIDLFEDPKLFIVYLDSPRFKTFVEFINQNDVIVRYIIQVQNGKAIIYNNLLVGNSSNSRYVNIYVATLSPKRVANFFEREIKDFKKIIDKY